MERVSAYAEGVRHERAMSESAAHEESTWTRKRTTAEGLMGRFWTFYSKVAQACCFCNLRERIAPSRRVSSALSALILCEPTTGRPPSTSRRLPSTRSCSGRGRGRDLLFLAELEQDPPCPVLDAGRWSCHRRLEPRPPSPQQSPARDTFPLAGLSSSTVCVAEAGRTQGRCRRDAARRTRPA